MAGIKLPYLRKAEKTWEFLVDGKPYLILGAELQNSSMSSAHYMDTVWQKISDMGVNTILGPVTWEDIEAIEGTFDFTELDKVLLGARNHDLRVILAWFGSFKNGASCYVPSWVKTNPQRFPRMQMRTSNGSHEVLNSISIFHDECVQADSKAFSALMKHLRQNDPERTVIMVQVENEVGILGDSRDRSNAAEIVFESPVPERLRDYLIEHWSTLLPELTVNFPHLCNPQLTGKVLKWEDLFGSSMYTDEIFMAYHFALYVEKVALAGKNEHPIPMFANAWLPRPGQKSSEDAVAAGGGKPGEYPSGGPVSTVLNVWYQFAPTLDMICPDIYTSNYTSTCTTYAHFDRPLFIPEQRRDDYGMRRVWEALGRFQALGASPFGIDTLELDTCAIRKHYKLLRSISSIILKSQLQPEKLFGFFFDEIAASQEEPDSSIVKSFGPYELTISRAFVFGKQKPGYGMILHLETNIFLLIGCGFKVQFKATSSTTAYTGILRYEEKSVADPVSGVLFTERKLNGDESRSGEWANMPNEDPDYGTSFVPITIPARTMISEVEVYWLERGDILA